MNCPKCGKSNEGSASFCMHCGAAITPQPIETPKQAAEKTLHAVPQRPMMRNQEPSKSSKWVAISLGIAVLVLALLAFGIFGLGLLRTKANTPQVPNVLNTTGNPNSGPNVIAVQGNPNVGPNITNTTGQPTPSVKPPQDIVDWLAHLKLIELKRKQMGQKMQGDLTVMAATAQASDLMDIIKDPETAEPGQKSAEMASQKVTEIQAAWTQLLNEYQSVKPPAACQTLANNYERVLVDYSALSLEILNAIAKKDINKALGVRNQEPLVRQDITQANSALNLVCTQNNINRDFEIEQEGNNPNSAFGINF